MKFWTVARFELGYQSRRRSTWMFAAIVIAAQSIIAMQAFLPSARAGGYFFNSPFVIGAILVVSTMAALPMIASVAGDAATRDAASRMEPLIHTTAVGTMEYVAGRFAGAFALIAVITVVLTGELALLGLLPIRLTGPAGPFRLMAYAGAWLVIAVPSVLTSTALLYAIAAMTRRALASHVGAAALFLLTIFANTVVAKHSGHWALGGQLDPFGLTVFSELSRILTASQKSVVLVEAHGALLTNRILWTSIAMSAIALTIARLRFTHRSPAPSTVKKEIPAAPAPAATALPIAAHDFGLVTRVIQLMAIALRSLRQIASSWGAIAMTAAAVSLVVSAPNFIAHLGTPLYPTTARMSMVLSRSGEVFWLIAPLLAVFYAGELIWSDRDARMSHITDAAPVPGWVWLGGRFAGLAAALTLFQCVVMAAGIIGQSLAGYYRFEPGVYAATLGLQLIDYLLFAALGIAVHVIIDHKYAAHLVLLLTCAFAAFAPMIGVEHNLIVFASDPGWSYSDMRGLGPFLGPVLWFKSYWAGCALLLGVLGGLLRGRWRWNRAAAWTTAIAMSVVVITGGFIFYNVEILNGERSTASIAASRAGYERKYRRYAALRQPRLTAISLQVEIAPSRGEALVRGVYTLVNDSPGTIASVHLTTATGEETGNVSADRSIVPVTTDDRLGYRIYTLAQPLHPGESMRLRFEVRHRRRGFPNSGIDTTVVANGTHLGSDVLPKIGYRAERELTGTGERAEQALPPAVKASSAGDEAARSERVAFDAVVGTTANQTAVAPGSLLRSWTSKGRRYFHYAANAPIRNGFSIDSAVYSVHRSSWRNVAIEILHDPRHSANLDRMARSVQASLATYEKELGPYPYAQVRLVETPGAGVGMHSDPIDISYSEGFAMLHPEADGRNVDLTFAVVAHELAHQWWGNQLSPAGVAGAPVVTESLAWYSAMNVIEKTHGPEHLGRLLDVLRDEYSSPRSRAGVPLLEANDWFAAYRRGALAMYALRESIGPAQMDLAVRRFFTKYKMSGRPLPTSRDLYAEFQNVTPLPMRPLLADLFERNTFWDLSTRRVDAQRVGGNEWRVTMDVSARKFVVDSAGAQTTRPMNDEVEIGVYGSDKTLYLSRHRIVEGDQRITVRVTGQPMRAGIDPRELLPDPRWSDNTATIGR